MKNKNSCGHGNVSYKIVRSLSKEIAKLLSLIINQMLDTVICPDSSYLSRFLQHDMTALLNYHPMSMLTYLIKLFLENFIWSTT